MTIRHATINDISLVLLHDRHISKRELENSVFLGRVLIAELNGNFIGWLRYNLFWDNTPFMNLLYVLEGHQLKGFGTRLVSFWEDEMRALGYKTVLTSTQQNETAQHFYTRLGYKAIGGFTIPGDTYEIIFSKEL